MRICRDCLYADNGNTRLCIVYAENGMAECFTKHPHWRPRPTDKLSPSLRQIVERPQAGKGGNGMNKDTQTAYEWAKKQDFLSVAARYAKMLAAEVDRLTAENADLLQKTQQLTETNKALESDNYNAEMNLSRLTERPGMAKKDIRR